MRKFKVTFFYGTDARATWTGDAAGYAMALTFAEIEQGLFTDGGWPTDDGFFIKIEPVA